jgi:ATP-dependent exoDNAse (exonuclease V) alpha subunit
LAIFHLNVKVISRAHNRSAVASAAYRHAGKFFDERLGKTFNFTNKKEVIYSEILLPSNADFFQNMTSEKLWNVVERFEKRIDARLAREIEFALPVELDQEQSIQLAREFIQKEFVALGMIADLAIHWKEDNPHAHVMLTTRKVTKSGFGEKDRTWNDKSLLLNWRKQWSEHANLYLRQNNIDARIDHRSYKEQEIDLTPTTHNGYSPSSASKKIEANLVRIDEILKKIERHYSVFGESEIRKMLRTYSKDNAIIQKTMEELKRNSKIIHLGVDENGHDRYTTKYMLELENNIQKQSDALLGRFQKAFNPKFIQKHIENYEKNSDKKLTEEQRYAVKHLTHTSSLSCLVGRAAAVKVLHWVRLDIYGKRKNIIFTVLHFRVSLRLILTKRQESQVKPLILFVTNLKQAISN